MKARESADRGADEHRCNLEALIVYPPIECSAVRVFE